MTNLNSSYAAIQVDNTNVTGKKDKITGNHNIINGSYNEALGNYNTITGKNTTVIGEGNHLDDPSGGKLFVYGAYNDVTLDKATEVTFHEGQDSIHMGRQAEGRSIVNNFNNKGTIFVNGFDNLSFVYHGHDTLMSYDSTYSPTHTEVLFTNSHVTGKNVFNTDDSLS